GDQTPTRRVGRVPARPAVPGTEPGTRAEAGRRQGTTGGAAEGDEGVGGLRKSGDVGEREGARTRPSKGGPSGGELQEGPMSDALTSGRMSPELLEVVARARREPEGRFHALAHLIDVPALERAYHRMRPEAAVGGGGVTRGRYGQALERNFGDLHGGRRAKQYRPQPIRRAYIPKDTGQQRP